ncbi:MAG: 30S ribosomal protein S9, partial [Nanoarchaeota archaeon]|nr:30S ribosomal protein S9 [Nanoarchaeota archaeon]
TGKIRINGKLIDAYNDKFLSLYIQTPLVLSNEAYKKYDIDIKVRGGGPVGRASVVRSVIAKALASKEKSLHRKFIEYDRTLLVDDKRTTEPQKPYRSAARALKQTSYR